MANYWHGMCPKRPLVLVFLSMDNVQYLFSLPQRGDSAVIMAIVKHHSGALCKLVGAGADLNLQNEVRSVTVNTTLCIIPGFLY